MSQTIERIAWLALIAWLLAMWRQEYTPARNGATVFEQRAQQRKTA